MQVTSGKKMPQALFVFVCVYLEHVARGLQLRLLLLLGGDCRDGVLHTNLGPGLGKVLIQLNLQTEGETAC